jgi:hypothetical protein
MVLIVEHMLYIREALSSEDVAGPVCNLWRYFFPMNDARNDSNLSQSRGRYIANGDTDESMSDRGMGLGIPNPSATGRRQS